MTEIRTNAKRGKGKFTGSLGIKDMYRAYSKDPKIKKKVEYSAFSKYLNEFNKLIINRIVWQSEEFKLPLRMGTLRVLKRERKLHLRKRNRWPVNYQESKKQGFIVYYEDDYDRKWKWNKRIAVIKWKSVYKFNPSRFANREIPKAVRQKVDYFS